MAKEITDEMVVDGSGNHKSIGMIFSYDNLEDLRQMVQDGHYFQPFSEDGEEIGDISDFGIKEYKYYAIVSLN